MYTDGVTIHSSQMFNLFSKTLRVVPCPAFALSNGNVIVESLSEIKIGNKTYEYVCDADKLPDEYMKEIDEIAAFLTSDTDSAKSPNGKIVIYYLENENYLEDNKVKHISYDIKNYNIPDDGEYLKYLLMYFCTAFEKRHKNSSIKILNSFLEIFEENSEKILVKCSGNISEIFENRFSVVIQPETSYLWRQVQMLYDKYTSSNYIWAQHYPQQMYDTVAIPKSKLNGCFTIGYKD